MPKHLGGFLVLIVVILATMYLALQLDFTRKLFNLPAKV